jgi:hypothetical protein
MVPSFVSDEPIVDLVCKSNGPLISSQEKE